MDSREGSNAPVGPSGCSSKSRSEDSCPWLQEFESPLVLATNWWAKAYRFANFSVGGLTLGRRHVAAVYAIAPAGDGAALDTKRAVCQWNSSIRLMMRCLRRACALRILPRRLWSGSVRDRSQFGIGIPKQRFVSRNPVMSTMQRKAGLRASQGV